MRKRIAAAALFAAAALGAPFLCGAAAIKGGTVSSPDSAPGNPPPGHNSIEHIEKYPDGNIKPDYWETIWLGEEAGFELADIAENEGLTHVQTRREYGLGVRAKMLQALAGYTYSHNTLTARGVAQVRVTISQPGGVERDLLLSGYVKDNGSATQDRFAEWYRNTVRVIAFDEPDTWGYAFRVAARVDFSGMRTDNLAFYSYYKENNTLRRIEAPDYSIDENGYVHFTTSLAGDIVISEGQLVSRQE